MSKDNRYKPGTAVFCMLINGMQMMDASEYGKILEAYHSLDSDYNKIQAERKQLVDKLAYVHNVVRDFGIEGEIEELFSSLGIGLPTYEEDS